MGDGDSRLGVHSHHRRTAGHLGGYVSYASLWRWHHPGSRPDLRCLGGRGEAHLVEFNAINVQVISGTGLTNGTPNGEGNLIVGYAENPSGFQPHRVQ